jgi:hypothetical protein
MVNPGFDLSDMGIALAEDARATGPDILPLDDMAPIAPDVVLRFCSSSKGAGHQQDNMLLEVLDMVLLVIPSA